jgi:hypothetical protein
MVEITIKGNFLLGKEAYVSDHGRCKGETNRMK